MTLTTILYHFTIHYTISLYHIWCHYTVWSYHISKYHYYIIVLAYHYPMILYWPYHYPMILYWPYHTISYHIIPYHTMSYHIIPYHTVRLLYYNTIYSIVTVCFTIFLAGFPIAPHALLRLPCLCQASGEVAPAQGKRVKANGTLGICHKK